MRFWRLLRLCAGSSVLDEIYCGFAVFGDISRGFAVSNRPLCPLHMHAKWGWLKFIAACGRKRHVEEGWNQFPVVAYVPCTGIQEKVWGFVLYPTACCYLTMGCWSQLKRVFPLQMLLTNHINRVTLFLFFAGAYFCQSAIFFGILRELIFAIVEGLFYLPQQHLYWTLRAGEIQAVLSIESYIKALNLAYAAGNQTLERKWRLTWTYLMQMR